MPRLPRPDVGDLLAAVSVTLVLVPQALAYAQIAGMPPHVGLLAAALPLIAAAPFADSPYLQTGPVALTALLTLGALDGRADLATEDYVRLGSLLALMVGTIRVALGVVRLGSVAYLMSSPVVSGFTSAAALLIVLSQVPTVLGVARAGDGVLADAAGAVTSPDDWVVEGIVLAAVAVAVIEGARRIHPRLPGIVLAVGVGIAAVALGDLDVAVVGDVPGSYPSLSLDLPWGETGGLVVPAVVIAVVGFAEPAAIARTFAAQERQRWSPDREMVGQGAANLASGIAGAFPVGGSFSRSALAKAAGARTRWTGALTGLLVLLVLPLAPVLEDLPRSVLAAIIIGTVVPLVRLGPIVGLWSGSRAQFLVAAGTFAATMAASPRVEYGVIVGVALAFAMHLFRELRTDHRVVQDGDSLHVEVRGVVWFPTSAALERAVTDRLAEHPETERVVIDLSGVGRLDYTGGEALRQIVDEAEASGCEIEITGVPSHARRVVSVHLGGSHGVPALDELPPSDRHQLRLPGRRHHDR